MPVYIIDDERAPPPPFNSPGSYGYFRDGRGWCVVAAADPDAIRRSTRDGWVPMPRYGSIRWDHVAVHAPLDDLFRRGGAQELSIEQLVEEGWAYREPPYEVDGARV